MPPLPYLDLLGKPYVRLSSDPARGLDCYGSVVEMFRRGGRPDPMIPAADEEARRLATGTALREERGEWQRVGTDIACAREALDVVHLRSDEPAGGVAVLVSVRPQRFLTSMPKRGVVSLPASALRPNVEAVYRWRGA